MTPSEVYLELYGRLPDLVHRAAEGLTPDELAQPPAGATNTIGWLLWHLTRVMDHHVGELLEAPQLWESGDWAQRFGDVDPDAQNHGYGHTAEQVAGVRPDSAEVVTAYFDAVWERTRGYLATLGEDDLDRIVDDRWNPPVTLGVRLVSIADDGLQHAGQAAYVRGALGI